MIRNTDTNSKTESRRWPLTVVAAERSDIVHLTEVDEGVQASWTLCAQHTRRQQPASPFHDSGCWFCTSIALYTGYTVVEDTPGALVDLSEWLARSRPLAAPLRAVERV